MPFTRHGLRFRSVYRRSPRYRQPFHWIEIGSEHAETIVLLHGLLAHAMTYRRVAHRLADRYRLVIPDLPAHGRDETFRSEELEARVAAMHGWLVELLDLLDAGPIHLVGHSLGAALSYLVARHDEHLLETVTLVNPGLKIDVPSWTRPLLQRLPTGLARLGANQLGLSLYEPIQWRGERMDPLERRSYLEPLRDRDRLTYILRVSANLLEHAHMERELAPLSVPSLLVWGRHDHLLPVERAPLVRRRLGAERLEIVDDAGHSPVEDSPEAFSRALRQFLTR
jgi:pimeloyl-ACP methyl ester carboxylesterase